MQGWDCGDRWEIENIIKSMDLGKSQLYYLPTMWSCLSKLIQASASSPEKQGELHCQSHNVAERIKVTQVPAHSKCSINAAVIVKSSNAFSWTNFFMLLKLEHSSNKKPNDLWQFSDDTQDMGALEKQDMAETEAVATYWVLTSWCKYSKGMSILSQQKERMTPHQVLVSLRQN